MLQPHYIARSVALLFMEMVGKLHGMPRSLVSDRDPLFISRFWQELFKMSGTTLRMSSAYHPQTDGQTKVANRVVEQYLRAFVHQLSSSWGRFLLWAKWLYNISQHSSTDLPPYEITFRKKPPSIPQYIAGTSQVEVGDDFMTNHEAVFISLRKKLLKAQESMKQIADAHRKDNIFEVGDWLLIKLQPRHQVSATGEPFSMLAKLFYRPFQILQKIDMVAYRVKLPKGCRIHPVFHCFLFEPFQSSSTLHEPLVELPPMVKDNQTVITPLMILNTR